MKDQSINPNILNQFGKNVKRIRLLKGLSQEKLAEKLQKSINFISLLENGKTGLTIQTIIDLCNVLNVDANELFSGLITISERNKNYTENENTLTIDDVRTNWDKKLYHFILVKVCETL